MRSKPTNLQENVVLAPFTTLKIGGPAKYYVQPKTVDEAVVAFTWAHQEKLPVAILGNGSNSLVSDKGFDGLVVVMANDQMEWNSPHVIVGAGVKLGQLIGVALQHGLGGLDWLISVPGTVGGSIFGNAGSRDEALGDYIEWVEAVWPDGSVKQWKHSSCDFKYRYSAFKEEPALILRAQLRLPEVDKDQERKKVADMAKKKTTNQPTTAASAGCMFQNPVADPERLPEDLRQYLNPNGTISAWRLISHVGLEGKQLGQIQISEKHANFMVNLGGATADQVVQLLSLVKQQVRDKLGVQLHEEVRYLGF